MEDVEGHHHVGMSFTCSTDAAGAFRCRGLRAGRYRASAGSPMGASGGASVNVRVNSGSEIVLETSLDPALARRSCHECPDPPLIERWERSPITPSITSPSCYVPRMLSLARRLEARVRHLSHEIGPRHYRRPEALAAATRYIADQLGEIGAAVREQEFFVDGQRFVNLEVVVPAAVGAGPEPACLVIGAHYDTVPSTPGADDNASGVAALLELAEQLGRERLKRTLRLVFFANEEPPFFPDAGMGSVFYADALARERVDVHVMVSLEMLGYYSDRANSQKYPPGLSLLYPDRGNFIGFVGNLSSRRRLLEVKRAFVASTDFPCESLSAPEWTVVVGLSDHQSFWKHGYAGLMITDTAFMRNPHYHQSTDTADTLDYERFAKVTEGIVAAVKRLGMRDTA
jgi:hypothetical protein